MFCQKCGNQLADGTNFCNKCGAKIGTNEVDLTVNSTTEKPKKAKNSVKKIGLIVGAIFIVILILLFSFGDNKPVLVPVEQIAEEYMKDSVAADKKWKNKKIELLGAVIEIGQFSNAKGDYIEFHNLYRNDFDKFTILASVEDKSKLDNIKKGDFVKVDGELIGYGKQKDDTTTVQIKGKNIKKLSEKEIKTETESYIEQEVEKLPAKEREQARQFFKSMLSSLAEIDTSKDFSGKSSESPLPGQTASKSDRQIDQNALDTLYGEWGIPNTGDIITFTKDSIETIGEMSKSGYTINRTKYEVLEAYDVKEGARGYIIRLKIFRESGTYIAKLRIVTGDYYYGYKPAMNWHDETNNIDFTSDKPYVKTS